MQTRCAIERLRIVGLLAICLAGCAGAQVDVRARSQKVDVRIDPATSRLAATTVTELEIATAQGGSQQDLVVELALHPDLVVEAVSAEGATVLERETIPPETVDEVEDKNERAVVPATLRLVLEDPATTVSLKIDYEGELRQDVAAGEVQGEIHNFSVQAHVGNEGVYLAPAGYWYPRLSLPDDAPLSHHLSDFELVTNRLEGFELVAGLEAVSTSEEAGDRLRWQSPFPMRGLVLLGGPLERHTRVHEGITLHAVIAPGKEAVAQDILAASAEYLDRYQPLIGPYPFSEFTVLEAFFSSGFAFPTCTQIAGSQLSEYRQYRRHGYLDHELLHNWWGNGIFGDTTDGNWTEGLTTYMANYAGFVLDGDEVGARKQRRNFSNFLSAIAPEHDLPLGTFGQEDGAGRGIGYSKGAAVFHMLERKIGSDEFLAGLRLFTDEYMGRHAGWDEIREVMERASGSDLSRFFDTWVRTAGAPRLEMTAAEWQAGADHVLVTIEQHGTSFELDVPLRLHYEEHFVDEIVTLDSASQEIEVPAEKEGLRAIELDPDFHLFRKLKSEEVMPTSALTQNAERLVIVLPDGEVAEPYRDVADSYRRAVLGDEEEPEVDHEVIERTVSSVSVEELAGGSVLVLGDGVRSPAVQEVLSRSRSPVRWHESEASFHVGDREFAGPGEAVFLTVHHPDRANSGVTVYFGNSERALSNAGVLSFYPNSLLVFDTPPGVEATSASGMPRAAVVERIDFEFPERIEFQ